MGEYLGTVFGKLRIPCHVYVESSFSYEEVRCEYDATELKLPEDIEAFKEQLVDKKRKEAEARGAPFYDGPMVRLRDYKIIIEDPNTEKIRLGLVFQPTSWFTYSATNKSLDEKVLLDEFGKVISIREKYVENPLDLNDVLANPTGVSTTLISEPENRMILVERSMKLSQYPGLYGVAAAGFMKRDYTDDKGLHKGDTVDGVPNPFLTIKRELEEEIGIDCSVNDFTLFSVGRAMDDLHVELFGETRTNLTVEEIKSAPKSSKYETLKMIDVPFKPKEVLTYVVRTIGKIPVGVPPNENAWIIGRSPKWVPAHAVATIQSLMKEYGYERVLRTVNNL